MPKKALIISRIGPDVGSRTGFVAQTLASEYHVIVMAERGNRPYEGPRTGDRYEVLERPLGTWNHLPMNMKKGLRLLQLNWLGVKKALTFKPDLIVCCDTPYSFPGMIGKLFIRSRFILDMHEICWDMGYGPFLSKVYKYLERFCFLFVSLWLVPSEDRARIVISTQRVKVPYVVLNNFPRNYRQSSSGSRLEDYLKEQRILITGFRIIYQGSITSDTIKGLVELARAVEMTEDTLLIQGRGPLLEELHKSLEHKTNIKFIPECSNTDTINWLRGCDLSFIYYDPSSLNAQYACSTKLYSSVFAEVPVLCNRLQAFVKHSQEYGGLVFFKDLSAEHIASSLSLLHGNDSLMANLKKETRSAANEFVKIDQERVLLEATKTLQRRTPRRSRPRGPRK